MIRKRMEQKNSMDRRILVDLLEFFLKLPLADVLRKLTHPTFDTDQFHSFFCASFIRAGNAGIFFFFRTSAMIFAFSL